MGLDLSAEGSDIRPHWAYSGFARFRERLAEHVGIDLRSMAGFGGEQIPWSTVDHPLVPLLNHSDCDGELSPSECETVAPALRAAVADWGDESPYDYDRGSAQSLADLMDHCASTDVVLEFR